MDELVNATKNVQSEHPIINPENILLAGLYWSPVVDGILFQEQPARLLSDGNYDANKNVIAGIVENEAEVNKFANFRCSGRYLCFFSFLFAPYSKNRLEASSMLPPFWFSSAIAKSQPRFCRNIRLSVNKNDKLRTKLLVNKYYQKYCRPVSPEINLMFLLTMRVLGQLNTPLVTVYLTKISTTV